MQNQEGLLSGGEAEVLLQALKTLRAASSEAVIAKAGLEQQSGLMLLDRLISEGSIVLLQPGKDPVRNLLIEAGTWRQVREELLKTLSDFHAQNPLKPGMTRESLRAANKLPPLLFDAALEKLRTDEEVLLQGALTALTNHRIGVHSRQK